MIGIGSVVVTILVHIRFWANCATASPVTYVQESGMGVAMIVHAVVDPDPFTSGVCFMQLGYKRRHFVELAV